MRKPYPLLLAVCFLLMATATRAQQDTVLAAHINQLIGREPAIHLRADSIVNTGAILQVYFNTDSSLGRGGLGETESEMLTELLAHLTTETNTQNILLLARDSVTGTWKTLDYFVDSPPVQAYSPVPNHDPYPNKPGKAISAQGRVAPGGGMAGLSGALTGKTVWLSPGHGWHNTGTGFITQRGTSNQLVEDFTTAETVDYYLLHYLMNAGASVWSVRERDLNPVEIIVDNDQGAPAYTETGTWNDGTLAGYGGTYRTTTADAAATATATYTPVVPVSGRYWVSVRFISGANRATDTRYTITHAGGTTTYLLNQEVHGNTWVYLGQFYFFAGGNYQVSITNQSAEAGQAIVADAVRLGGGIGADPDCANGGAASGKPRFEESARQYARYQGNPVCREDVTVRPIYTEWELAKGPAAEIANAVYVAFHTNAGGGTGTETYRYNGLGSSQPVITPGSTELRDSIHKQVIADLRAGWRSTWTDRGVKEANLGELRELHTIPGTLVELAFHDLAADATDLRAPEFRRMAARAIYKGILKFFNYRDGAPLVFLPEEPTRLAAVNTGSAQIQLSWTAPVTGGIYGGPATAYHIYYSENGRGFGNPIEVTTTTYTFTGVPDKTYFFKVAAINDGGESFTSGVVAAHTPAGITTSKYLLVDGFDRLDASAMLLKNEGAALGNVRRMFLEKMNSYDYMVEHGNGLASCNLAFDGAQHDAVSSGAVSLSGYFGIDWFLGEESTADKTLDATEKQLVKNYLDAGGRLLISGAEIGWDLGRAASANADLSFYNNYLKAVYVSDGAGTYNFTGTPALLNGSGGTFGNGTNGYYNVDFPDVISPVGGSELVLNYSGGSGGVAGIGYKGNFHVLYFGFPLEAITDETVRNNIFCRSANYLQSSITLPVNGFTLTGRAEGAVNRLQWTTLSEINLAYFITERSMDGIHFQAIGAAVTAKGSSVQGYRYDYNDSDAPAVCWYRIKAVDTDGRETWSNIVLIRNARSRMFYVLENPATAIITLRVANAGPFRLTLANGQGQVVYQSGYNVISSGDIKIPAAHLAKGMYWLSAFTAEGNVQTFKILVK